MTLGSLHRSPVALAAYAMALAGSPALAAGHASKEDAIAMVKRALDHYKSAGPAKGLADISAKDNAFTDGELYVAVSEISTGVIKANSRNAGQIGKNFSELKDVDGKPFVRQELDLAKAGKPFWIDYRFLNPASKEIESKSTYCEPYDGLIFCVGVYR